MGFGSHGSWGFWWSLMAKLLGEDKYHPQDSPHIEESCETFEVIDSPSVMETIRQYQTEDTQKQLNAYWVLDSPFPPPERLKDHQSFDSKRQQIADKQPVVRIQRSTFDHAVECQPIDQDARDTPEQQEAVSDVILPRKQQNRENNVADCGERP